MYTSDSRRRRRLSDSRRRKRCSKRWRGSGELMVTWRWLCGDVEAHRRCTLVTWGGRWEGWEKEEKKGMRKRNRWMLAGDACWWHTPTTNDRWWRVGGGHRWWWFLESEKEVEEEKEEEEKRVRQIRGGEGGWGWPGGTKWRNKAKKEEKEGDPIVYFIDICYWWLKSINNYWQIFIDEQLSTILWLSTITYKFIHLSIKFNDNPFINGFFSHSNLFVNTIYWQIFSIIDRVCPLVIYDFLVVV